MLRWALTGADAGKVTTTGDAAHDLRAVYETGKETVLNKVDRINNVYDLEGNGKEWTAEANSVNGRTYRSGNYKEARGKSYRYGSASPVWTNDDYCSRLILYIKN